MVSNIQTLLLLFFKTRSSIGTLTDESVDLCSRDEVNYSNYIPLKLEDCGCDNMCIRKCCRNGFYYYHKVNVADGQLTGRCEKDYTINFSVPIYEVDKKIQDLDYGFRIGIINCANKEVTEINLEQKDSIYYFNIQQDGSWYYPHLNTSSNNTDYCVNSKNGKITYYYCKDTVDGNALFRRAGAIIPIPFLLLTALVYVILPKSNIHTKSLILHTLCLAFVYILQTLNQHDIMESAIICKILGNLMMYSWYASVFWLNVMCIDIWLTFSGLGFRRRFAKENILFIILSMYAWGSAGLYLLVTRLFDVSSGSPGIYNQGCFKSVLLSYWFYLTTITMFTALNTAFHILTTINIRRARKETAVLKSTNSRKHTSEVDEKFTIYWNLFCMMSIHSALYYLRLFHVTLEKLGWYKSTYFDIFIHIMYISYAIIIFIVFVCKRKIRKDLKERYRQFTGKRKENESSTSTTISTKFPSEIEVSSVHLTSFKHIYKEESRSEM